MLPRYTNRERRQDMDKRQRMGQMEVNLKMVNLMTSVEVTFKKVNWMTWQKKSFKFLLISLIG
jgi:hypothetical protein